MPHRPLGEHNFPKIRDEENRFDSYDEDTDEEVQGEPPENLLNQKNVEAPLIGMQRPRTANCTIL